jgi:ribosome-associated toxin RatA of RatAB toxin-antitoxin module
MKKIARSAIVEHSAAEMYRLVEDIESYPAFLPWCLGAQVHERTGESTRATLTVGLRGIRQSFTTLNHNRPGEGIELRLAEGPFRAFSAAWTFKPLAEDACGIEFRLEYEFANRSLSKLLEPLFHHIADTMVDAFSKRADALYS